jgi:hypothetical protein
MLANGIDLAVTNLMLYLTWRKKMKKMLYGISFGIISAMVAGPAFALVGYADEVTDYHDSGAGPVAGPYGILHGAAGPFAVSVPLSVVLGNDVAGNETALSLPTGSFVTVRFTDELVGDGQGNDLFIQEVGPAGESADVFVSSNGTDFTFLGVAKGGIQTALNFSDIGFASNVSYVKIVGLDNNGASPGFDVANVQGLNVTPVPEPETYAMLLAGLGLVGFVARRGKQIS